MGVGEVTVGAEVSWHLSPLRPPSERPLSLASAPAVEIEIQIALPRRTGLAKQGSFAEETAATRRGHRSRCQDCRHRLFGKAECDPDAREEGRGGRSSPQGFPSAAA